MSISGEKTSWIVHQGQKLRDQFEEDRQRIADLEAALERNKQLLARAHKKICKIYDAVGWKILNKLNKEADRFISEEQHAALRSRLESMIHVYRAVVKKPPRTDFSITAGEYTRWIKRNEPGKRALREQRLSSFPSMPAISIILPIGDASGRNLRLTLDSMVKQSYQRWELWPAGPAPSREVDELLRKYSQDQRIKPVAGSSASSLAGHVNAALASVTGSYVMFLNPADTLAPFALHAIIQTINVNPDADFAYSDEDSLNETGTERFDPYFKPDWSPELLRSQNYIGCSATYRRDLVEAVGGYRGGFDGAEGYDLILRATERAKNIIHVQKVLYHGRVWLETSGRARESSKKAVAEHLDRCGERGSVKDGLVPGTQQVAYSIKDWPLVSVIIANRDHHDLLAKCLDSLALSTYLNYEIIIVENHSEKPETFKYYEALAAKPNVKIVTWARPFNYAAVNNFAVTHAAGELLLFLNNDVEAINPDWLERMVEHAVRPGVGAVGAKLLFPDGTVQHAGVVVGIGGLAGHPGKGFPRNSAGFFNRLLVTQNFSAVTAACLLTRKEIFEKVDRFDEDFILAFNDIDLCLKIREQGYSIVWTPYAELSHYESKTRGPENTIEKQVRYLFESELFQMKWEALLEKGDPFYSPHLTRTTEDMSLRL